MDISGILKQKPKAQPSPVEPKTDKEPMLAPLPGKLLAVPGFITEYADYTMRTGQYPNRILTFCSALAFLAFLTGRKITDERNNRGNIKTPSILRATLAAVHEREENLRRCYEQDIDRLTGRLVELRKEALSENADFDEIKRIAEMLTSIRKKVKALAAPVEEEEVIKALNDINGLWEFMFPGTKSERLRDRWHPGRFPVRPPGVRAEPCSVPAMP